MSLLFGRIRTNVQKKIPAQKDKFCGNLALDTAKNIGYLLNGRKRPGKKNANVLLDVFNKYLVTIRRQNAKQ